MYPRATFDEARRLARTGLHAGAVAHRLGLPGPTVAHWLRGDRRGPRADGRDAVCPRGQGAPLDEQHYSSLLGAYLGDGHIVVGRRGVASLSVFCDDAWPGIAEEVRRALDGVMPSSSVCTVARTGCSEIKSYSRHWPCLFPQHGPGPQHTRPIVLEPWQLEVVEREPGRLLRGLFHSDGCRITNWAQKQTPTGPKRYEYPPYMSSNKSTDILAICAGALDLLGIPHRRPRRDMISVARRAGVAALDECVGPKY